MSGDGVSASSTLPFAFRWPFDICEAPKIENAIALCGDRPAQRRAKHSWTSPPPRRCGKLSREECARQAFPCAIVCACRVVAKPARRLCSRAPAAASAMQDSSTRFARAEKIDCERSWLFLGVRVDLVLEDKRRLCKCEEENQRDHGPDLEIDPGRSGKVSPHDFVKHRQAEEKHCPTPRQAAPAFVAENKGVGEYMLDEQLVESEPADQQEPEQRVKHCGLHFDEDVVAQIERKPAKDQHDDGGKEGHGRQAPIANVSCSQREQNGRHETRR